MREELELQLRQEYPFMDHPRRLECGEGWFPLLRRLCADIAALYDGDGVPTDLILLQVKEKFGGLRIYYKFPDSGFPDTGKIGAVQAFDFLGNGTLRLMPGGGADEKERARRQAIGELVRETERRSREICELCSAPGEIQTLPWRWRKCLCPECFSRMVRSWEARERKPRGKISDYLD